MDVVQVIPPQTKYYYTKDKMMNILNALIWDCQTLSRSILSPKSTVTMRKIWKFQRDVIFCDWHNGVDEVNASNIEWTVNILVENTIIKVARYKTVKTLEFYRKMREVKEIIKEEEEKDYKSWKNIKYKVQKRTR